MGRRDDSKFRGTLYGINAEHMAALLSEIDGAKKHAPRTVKVATRKRTVSARETSTDTRQRMIRKADSRTSADDDVQSDDELDDEFGSHYSTYESLSHHSGPTRGDSVASVRGGVALDDVIMT